MSQKPIALVVLLALFWAGPATPLAAENQTVSADSAAAALGQGAPPPPTAAPAKPSPPRPVAAAPT